MGPLVVDTLEELRNIQQSLWEVSPAGSGCSFKHGWLLRKSGPSVQYCFLSHRAKTFLHSDNVK